MGATISTAHNVLRSLTAFVSAAKTDPTSPKLRNREDEIVNKLSTTFENLLTREKHPEAAKLLVAAYNLVDGSQLRYCARVILGHATQLSKVTGNSESITGIAPREFLRDVDYSKIECPDRRGKMVAIELEAWVAMWGTTGDPAEELAMQIKRSEDLRSKIDPSWRGCSEQHLGRILRAVTILGDKAAASQNEDFISSRGRKLALSYRLLGRGMQSILAHQDAANTERDPIWQAIAFGTPSGLEEYIDLEVPYLQKKMIEAIRSGDTPAFQATAEEISLTIGYGFSGLTSGEEIRKVAIEGLATFRGCWRELTSAPEVSTRELVYSQMAPIVTISDALALACELRNDPKLTESVATCLREFASDGNTRAARAPATAIAPIWLAASSLFESASHLKQDPYLELAAAECILEAARLFTLSSWTPLELLIDTADRVSRLTRMNETSHPESAYKALVEANIARLRKDFLRSKVLYENAASHLTRTIQDPDVRGLQALTYQTANVYHEACRMADLAHDPLEGDRLLLLAADALREAADLFNDRKASAQIRQTSDEYRAMVVNRVRSRQLRAQDLPTPPA